MAEEERVGYAETIARGNYVLSLEATRDAIAEDLEQCESKRDKAALYLKLLDTLERIEAARPREAEVDAVDEIAKRRAARRTRSA